MPITISLYYTVNFHAGKYSVISIIIIIILKHYRVYMYDLLEVVIIDNSSHDSIFVDLLSNCLHGRECKHAVQVWQRS